MNKKCRVPGAAVNKLGGPGTKQMKQPKKVPG